MTRTEIKKAERLFNDAADSFRNFDLCEDADGQRIAAKRAHTAASIAIDFVDAGIEPARWQRNAEMWTNRCDFHTRRAANIDKGITF